jgi:hypothetical protein
LKTATIEAYTMQYGEIFGITAIVCVIGALLGLLISGRHEHADEPSPPVAPVDTEDTDDTDDTPTTLIDAPTQAISTRPDPPDQTVRIQQQPPPGRHRR